MSLCRKSLRRAEEVARQIETEFLQVPPEAERALKLIRADRRAVALACAYKVRSFPSRDILVSGAIAGLLTTFAEHLGHDPGQGKTRAYKEPPPPQERKPDPPPAPLDAVTGAIALNPGDENAVMVVRQVHIEALLDEVRQVKDECRYAIDRYEFLTNALRQTPLTWRPELLRTIAEIALEAFASEEELCAFVSQAMNERLDKSDRRDG